MGWFLAIFAGFPPELAVVDHLKCTPPPPTLTQGPVTDTPLPSPTPTAAFMYTISWRLHHFVIHYNTQCSNLHLDNAADDDNLLHHQIYSLVVFDVYLL